MLVVSNSALAEGALPLRFETLTGPRTSAGEFSVFFSDFLYLADKVWFVSGTCATDGEAAPISVKDYAYMAEFVVYLTPHNYLADQVVCVTNPDSAPQAFWDAYSRR